MRWRDNIGRMEVRKRGIRKRDEAGEGVGSRRWRMRERVRHLAFSL